MANELPIDLSQANKTGLRDRETTCDDSYEIYKIESQPQYQTTENNRGYEFTPSPMRRKDPRRNNELTALACLLRPIHLSDKD